MKSEPAFSITPKINIKNKPDINLEIKLIPEKISLYLGIIVITLLIMSLGVNLVTYLTGHDHLRGIIPFFYIDRERNLPTGFTIFLCEFAAILLLIITSLKWKQSRAFPLHWSILFLGFSLMAIDEGWSFHEKIDQPGSYFDSSNYHGFFHFAWIIPFLFILPLLFLLFLKFLKEIPFRTRRLFLISAMLYVGGTIGIESIGGYLSDNFGETNWYYYIAVTVEEGMEMFGLIIFIYALMDYLRNNFTKIKLQFIK